MKGLRWMIVGAFLYDYLRKRKLVQELTNDKTQLLEKVSEALINPVGSAIAISTGGETNQGSSEFGLDA